MVDSKKGTVTVGTQTLVCRDHFPCFSDGPVCNAKGDPVQVLVSGGNPKWVYIYICLFDCVGCMTFASATARTHIHSFDLLLVKK